jgi:hypothetical protein
VAVARNSKSIFKNQKEKIDAIFLQETMRQDFTDQELMNLVNGELFHWHWRAA